MCLPAKCDQFDGAIGFQCFDAAVNHGVGDAAKFLQRAVDVKDDGIVGDQTSAAVKVMLRLPLHEPCSWLTFGKGWTRHVAGDLKYMAKDA